jgi:hypothetical protein
MDKDQHMEGSVAANSLDTKGYLNSMWCLQSKHAQVQLTVRVCEGTNTGHNANVTVTLPGGLWLHDLNTQPVVVKIKDWVIKGKPVQTMFMQVPHLMLLSTTEEELDKEPMLQWTVNNTTNNKEGHAMNGETYFVGFAQSNSRELVAERRLAEVAAQDAVPNTNKADKYVQRLIAGLQGAAVHQLLRIEDKDPFKFNTKIKLVLSPPGQPLNASSWALLQCQVLAANVFGPDGLLRNEPVLLPREITHKDMTNGTANLQVSRPVVRLYFLTLNPRVQPFEPCSQSLNNTTDCCVPTLQPRTRSAKDMLVLPAKRPCLATNSNGGQEPNKSAMGLVATCLGTPHPATGQFSFEPNAASLAVLATKTRGLEPY